MGQFENETHILKYMYVYQVLLTSVMVFGGTAWHFSVFILVEFGLLVFVFCLMKM